MGDMGDAFRDMKSMSQARRQKVEPSRMEVATEKVSELGYDVNSDDGQSLTFELNGNTIRIFPYTGWFSGKGVKDGRGIFNLIEQLKEKK
jgi:hypothetical protein